MYCLSLSDTDPWIVRVCRRRESFCATMFTISEFLLLFDIQKTQQKTTQGIWPSSARRSTKICHPYHHQRAWGRTDITILQWRDRWVCGSMERWVQDRQNSLLGRFSRKALLGRLSREALLGMSLLHQYQQEILKKCHSGSLSSAINMIFYWKIILYALTWSYYWICSCRYEQY